MLFQFLYGAIGSAGAENLSSPSELFQFLYGAIGRNQAILVGLHRSSFNSYMVRLEAFMRFVVCQMPSVSIPIWCDWKRLHLEQQRREDQFQFLYGAIGS